MQATITAFFSAMAVYLRPRLLCVAALGFSCGLPFSLMFATLSFWLKENGVSTENVTLFAATGTPFVFKFLWAPLVDHMWLPKALRKIGKRRTWILGAQACLFIALLAIGHSDPTQHLSFMAVMCVAAAFFSATQDIAVDAFRVERLEEEEQASGAAAYVFGWRIGALLSGAGTLFIAEYSNWQTAYTVMASLLGVGALAAIFCGEKTAPDTKKERVEFYVWINQAVIEPFKDFMTRPRWLAVLLFIVLFKIGDAFASVVFAPFAVELGFGKDEYAAVVKIYGAVATLAGSMAGGAFALKRGMKASLWFAGIIQMLSTFVFVWLYYAGHDITVLTATVSVENFAAGFGSAIFVAYLSGLCRVPFTATQFALFTSLAAVGRTWFAPFSGTLAENIGWPMFYVVAGLAALPGIMLVSYVIGVKEKR